MSTTPLILLADDPADDLEHLQSILSADHDLLTADTGPRALELAGKQPDLILLSLMLPAMDGLTVCARLKSEPATADIPVIFITDDTYAEMAASCFAAGGVDVISKPIDPATLRARVATQLTLRHQSEQLHLYKEQIRSTEREAAQAIAELDRSHRNLLAVLNQFRGGTLLLDDHGRIEFASDACRAIDNLDPRTLLGKDWRLALPLDPQALTQVAAMMATPAPARSRLELTWTSRRGQTWWVECDVRDAPDDDRRRLLFLYDVSENRALRLANARGPLSRLIGTSPAILNLHQHILDIARGDWTILIEGETGTGKELVAQAIHAASSRAAGPFIAVNAAGLTPTLLTSQLFGHRKGSFTGAYQDQEGFFESARGGTLFLDEIGDLPIELQAALLRVLQEKEIIRIGEARPRKVDVRVLTATHLDLLAATQSGRFRQDLLYRLRVARIQVPPLRDRRTDIPLLASYFLDQASREMDRQELHLSPGVVSRLTNYPWPGNVRELKSCIDQAVIYCKSHHIDVPDLPPELQDPALTGPAQPQPGDNRPMLPPSPLTLPAGPTSEPERILAALAQTKGNRLRAAKLLGIGRATLYRRLASLGLDHR